MGYSAAQLKGFNMKKTHTTLCIFIVIGLAVGFYNGCQSLPPDQESRITSMGTSDGLVIATWNVRGYPEKRAEDRTWFTNKLSELNPDIVCIQEITTANMYADIAFEDMQEGVNGVYD
jgi:hypothetical protein